MTDPHAPARGILVACLVSLLFYAVLCGVVAMTIGGVL